MAMDRRRFLGRLAAAAAGLLALLLAAAGLRRRRHPREDPLAGEIRRQFADLDPDDALIERFVRDHQQLSPRALRYDVPDRVDVLGAFLLSTDFFQGGGRGARRLAYVRYYDPYVSPCYNPLVRSVGPEPGQRPLSGGGEAPRSSSTGTRGR